MAISIDCLLFRVTFETQPLSWPRLGCTLALVLALLAAHLSLRCKQLAHERSKAIPTSREDFYIDGPVNEGCANETFPLRVLGADWLEVDFAKDRPDPPQLGHAPLSDEAWTWARRDRFLADNRSEHLLRQRQALRDLTKLFRRFGISYWLSSGTLLGVYRHGTFLPWDDDSDVVIPHEHAPRFKSRSFQEQAQAFDLHVQDGYFCGSAQYTAPLAYLRRTVLGDTTSALDLDALYDDCNASIGFFGRVTLWHADEQLRVWVDVWHAFPVTLPLSHLTGGLQSSSRAPVLYSYGGGAWLFSRRDIYPLQPCWLQGEEYTCPARSRLWLSRDYKDLSLPWSFNSNLCDSEERRRDGSWRAKWMDTSVEEFPDVPQLFFDFAADELGMHIPLQYHDEVDFDTRGIFASNQGV